LSGKDSIAVSSTRESGGAQSTPHFYLRNKLLLETVPPQHLATMANPVNAAQEETLFNTASKKRLNPTISWDKTPSGPPRNLSEETEFCVEEDSGLELYVAHLGASRVLVRAIYIE